MQTYDADIFDPPAPLAHVKLRNPQSKEVASTVPMLLDSGADVSLVPSEFARQIGLAADVDVIYELTAFDGTTSTASVAQLEMIFLNKTFRGRFLLIDQPWGIIGRDILNLVAVVLDGPNLTWREQGR